MAKRTSANYQSFSGGPSSEETKIEEDEDEDETPQEGGVMIHVVPESGRSRWSPIEDLDSFFLRMYQYHQKHGFLCMMLQELFELAQFVFIVCFTVFLFNCVNYPVLFRDDGNTKNLTKITISDVILPLGQSLQSINIATWGSIFVAFVFWLLRLVKVLYHFVQFWEIKNFFNTALKINDSELDNLTWHEVQRKIREVQKEHEMCIHKKDLTELDIYHRILRFKNYLVAMWNKNLIPVCLDMPVVGSIVFLTRGYKYNIEMLLFWGPGSPFENNWHLREDYKKVGKRKDLAEALSKTISWMALANFILCPLVLLWQILYFFFNYVEIIKREPGSLGSRCWSLHGRVYLRHFNELDHELNARLNRAYRPATKYMNIFTSPIMTVLAKNIAFVSGAILAVLLLLSVYDEDVLTVEHVLTVITVLGAVVAGCRVFIPDENLVWCPEQLMTAVLAHVHYLPDSWRGQAHTNFVRQQFSQLFQYKVVYLLQELISPIVTPYMLFFHLRPKALEIVDFYRQFTVEVVGVGDVCSFAQMDIRKHGCPLWQPHDGETGTTRRKQPQSNNLCIQAEDGKTELSLIHFTLTNPHWKPPADAENFVSRLRAQACRDAELLDYNTGTGLNNELGTSLQSVSSLGAGYNTLATSMLKYHLRGSHAGSEQQQQSRRFDRTNPFHTSHEESIRRGGLSRTEGPLLPEKGVLLSGGGDLCDNSEQTLNYERPTCVTSASLGASVFGCGPDLIVHNEPLELTTADMALSTLYLHEIHHRQLRRRGGNNLPSDSLSRSLWHRPNQEMPNIQEQQLDEMSEDLQRKNEKLPLLKKP